MDIMVVVLLVGLLFLSLAFVLWINSKSSRKGLSQRAEVSLFEAYRLKFFIAWLLLDGELWLKTRQVYQDFLSQTDSDQDSRQIWDEGLRRVGTLAQRFGKDSGKDFASMLASFETRYTALRDQTGGKAAEAELRKKGKAFEPSPG